MSRRRHSDCELIPTPATWGDTYNRKPPTNDFGITAAIVSIVATAASAAVSYQGSENQAKQAEYNAEAQADALRKQQRGILNEKERQQLEFQENQRRTAENQRRLRARQLAGIADAGVVAGVGSALVLEASTWNANQTELADAAYVNQIQQQQMGYQAKSAAYEAGNALTIGRAQANAYRNEGTATLIGAGGSVLSSSLKLGNYKKPETATNTSTTAPATVNQTSGK